MDTLKPGSPPVDELMCAPEPKFIRCNEYATHFMKILGQDKTKYLCSDCRLLLLEISDELGINEWQIYDLDPREKDVKCNMPKRLEP